jgi:arylsulfatase A
MNRREFIKKTSAAAGALGLSMPGSAFAASGKAGKNKPNIIFIFADQLRSHALGCYGNEQLKTPNIDRLAKEGVKFTNAISTAPVFLCKN